MKQQVKDIEYTPLAHKVFYLPAEWEDHSATWLSYPHNPETFFERTDAAQNAFIEMVFWLTQSEDVHINVNDVLVLFCQFAENEILGVIRILVFIHQDITEPILIVLFDQRIELKQLNGLYQ